MSTGPLFGVIPAGQPLIAAATSTPSETSFLYTLPEQPFSHLSVFLLPGVTLPSDTAAAIYLATAQEVAGASASGQTPNFKFLGGIGAGKESAVFKVGDRTSSSGPLVLGVSVEPAASVGQRIEELAAGRQSAAAPSQAEQVALAQKIIKNAFDFLASFSGSAGPGGIEVVPLKAFEEWWKKFEGRVRSDPGFLTRQAD